MLAGESDSGRKLLIYESYSDKSKESVFVF